MKENAELEPRDILEKETMIEMLSEAICFEDTGIRSIRYSEDTDMVRIKHREGFSVCISAEGKSALALLYEMLHELKPFLQMALAEVGWDEAFGPNCSFLLRRVGL